MPLPDPLAYELLICDAREVAEHIRARLVALSERFPSDELQQAIREVEQWQAHLEAEPPTPSMTRPDAGR